MPAFHPYEIYKKFINIKTHMLNKNFYYNKNNPKWISYDRFVNDKNYASYIKISNKLSKIDNIDALFLSNILNNQKTILINFLNNDTIEIYEEWKNRLNNLEYNFLKDIKKLIKEYNINDFKKIYYLVEFINFDNEKVTEINMLLYTNKKEYNYFNNFILKDITPETAIILDEIFNRKYNENMLLKYSQKCKNQFNKKEYIKLYKYKYFFNMNSLLKKESISVFKDKI